MQYLKNEERNIFFYQTYNSLSYIPFFTRENIDHVYVKILLKYHFVTTEKTFVWFDVACVRCVRLSGSVCVCVRAYAF